MRSVATATRMVESTTPRFRHRRSARTSTHCTRRVDRSVGDARLTNITPLSWYGLKLARAHFRVQQVLAQKFFMSPPRHDSSRLKHEDRICIPDGRHSMGDDEGGSGADQMLEGLDDQ